MTLQIGEDGAAALVGHCPSEDAEALLRHLSAHPAAGIDWRGCEGAHTAVVQVLIAARARPIGPPANRFLARFVEPLLNQGASQDKQKAGFQPRPHP
jgi:hypothetical protein